MEQNEKHIYYTTNISISVFISMMMTTPRLLLLSPFFYEGRSSSTVAVTTRFFFRFEGHEKNHCLSYLFFFLPALYE
jgi:hypothetical protein